MLEKNDYVIVGVSGGADSVCLLHILKRLSETYNLQLKVVHINHCIRGKDADDDEKYVEQLCQKFNLDFFKFKIDIKKQAKELSLTEEEAGRFVRYKCFNEVCQKFNGAKIAVAHNKNDNAETIIMRFIRGTGLKGLCGISPIRKNIIRPLIDCQRNEIENYCKHNNLEFKTDITNTMDIYTRNKIRLNLIPWIAENMNEKIVSVLVKNASIIAEEERFLENITEKTFFDCVLNNNFKNEVLIDIEKFQQFHKVLKRRIVRKACRYFSKDLYDVSYKHINNVIELTTKETGKILELPSQILVEKKYNILKFYRKQEKSLFCLKEPLYFNYELMYNKIIKINQTDDIVVLSEKEYNEFFEQRPYFTLQIDKSKVKGSINIRNRRNGDRIFIQGVGNKKLKNIFSENKIPEKERQNILIVSDEENIISIVEIKISDTYKLNSKTNEKINIYFWRVDAL